MNAKFASVLFSAVLTASAAGQVAAMTGNELYDDMTSRDPAAKLSALVYVRGVTDGLTFATDVARLNDARGWICFPENGITARQAHDIVRKHLHDHPERRHIKSEIIVLAALMDIFPCPEPKAINTSSGE